MASFKVRTSSQYLFYDETAFWPSNSRWSTSTTIFTVHLSMCDLGITISDELDWSPHIDFITSKASYTLSFLRRNLRSSPQSLGELLQWRHNDRDGVSNHQPHDCLLNHLFRLSWKKTSKLRITGLCEGNSLGTREFPAQRASNVENVSIWWCRQVAYILLVRSQSIMQQRHGGVSGWPHPEDRAHTAPGRPICMQKL